MYNNQLVIINIKISIIPVHFLTFSIKILPIFKVLIFDLSLQFANSKTTLLIEYKCEIMMPHTYYRYLCFSLT